MAVTGALCAVALAVLAQTRSVPAVPPASPAPPPSASTWSVSAGLTWDTSQFDFRFDNPSRFDTDTLVPHSFEQRYRRPHAAATIGLRVGREGRQATTTLHVGTRRIIRASDIDTFLQPDGDIATSGTDGPVSLRGLAIRQTLPASQVGAWLLSAAVGYARGTADFQPDERVVTHTRPPSVTRTFITDNEYTTTQVFSAGMELTRARARGHWRHEVAVRVDPLVSARLLIQLPQKYPGVDLTFAALGSGAGAGWTVERRIGTLMIGVRVDAGIAWRYRPSAAYGSRSVRVTAFAGR